MPRDPLRILRGAEAIGRHLGLSAKQVQYQHQQGLLPTFRVGGTPYATVRALDEWRDALEVLRDA